MSDEETAREICRQLDKAEGGEYGHAHIIPSITVALAQARAEARREALEECWRIAMAPQFTDQPHIVSEGPLEIGRRIRALAKEEK